MSKPSLESKLRALYASGSSDFVTRAEELLSSPGNISASEAQRRADALCEATDGEYSSITFGNNGDPKTFVGTHRPALPVAPAQPVRLIPVSVEPSTPVYPQGYTHNGPKVYPGGYIHRGDPGPHVRP